MRCVVVVEIAEDERKMIAHYAGRHGRKATLRETQTFLLRGISDGLSDSHSWEGEGDWAGYRSCKECVSERTRGEDL